MKINSSSLNAISILESKYADLVWYARSKITSNDNEGLGLSAIEKTAYSERSRIKQKYPEEASRIEGQMPFDEEVLSSMPESLKQYIADQINPDWEHGFNSGALAICRFITTLSEQGIETAMNDFPDLNT